MTLCAEGEWNKDKDPKTPLQGECIFFRDSESLHVHKSWIKGHRIHQLGLAWISQMTELAVLPVLCHSFQDFMQNVLQIFESNLFCLLPVFVIRSFIYSGVHWKMNIPHLYTKLHNYTVLFYYVKMPASSSP